MRYTVSVQHKSENELDFEWYPLSTTDDAAVAVHEYLKFQMS